MIGREQTDDRTRGMALHGGAGERDGRTRIARRRFEAQTVLPQPGKLRGHPVGKLALCLHNPGNGKVATLTDIILDYLKAQGGFMPVTDKNPPEEIHALFGVSKKTYKKAIGALYKKRLITFENNGTKLVDAS